MLDTKNRGMAARNPLSVMRETVEVAFTSTPLGIEVLLLS